MIVERHFHCNGWQLGASLIPIGQDLIVTGHSFAPAEEAAYFTRFDGQGALTYAKRLTACGATRVRIESGTLRASGDLAFFGTYDVGPERAFFATVSADGQPHGVHAIWTGSILQDVTGVAVAELPTSGFVSLARYVPYVSWSSALELSTHDSQGIRTEGKGYDLKDQAGTALAKVEPRALRLTTDGGALVVAHVTDDGPPNEFGLWISKLPARTFDAPFDTTCVEPAPSTFVEDPCTLDVSDASVNVQDIALEDVDVTSLVGAKPITPTIAKRTQWLERDGAASFGDARVLFCVATGVFCGNRTWLLAGVRRIGEVGVVAVQGGIFAIPTGVALVLSIVAAAAAPTGARHHGHTGVLVTEVGGLVVAGHLGLRIHVATLRSEHAQRARDE